MLKREFYGETGQVALHVDDSQRNTNLEFILGFYY